MSQYDKIFEYENIFTEKAYALPVGDILQVSELSIIPGGEIPEHIQPCDELTYVISGKATIISDDKSEVVSEREIHFIKKGIKHRILAGSDEFFRYICIGLVPNNKCNEIKAFTDLEYTEQFIAKDNGDIRRLTEMLLNEFYSRDENSDIMVNSYLTQIILTLTRIYKMQARYENREQKYSYNASKLTLYDILRYVDREYINIKNVKEIAEKLSYNEDYVSHLFKRKMGITLKDYLLRKKISTAMELLATSNLKIEEIAEYLNFSSAHTFYQAFRKITGISPSAYKKSNSGI